MRYGQAPPDLAVLAQTRVWLREYFSGRRPASRPPLQAQGTPFRRLVWQLLLEVPYGQTVSYGELATRLSRRLGRPVAARAIGGAVGHNPIALIMPCHRVIGSDGSLTGYAGGLWRKRWLLDLEAGHGPALPPGHR